MKDEIAQNIANELRQIREELQRLTSAVRSSTNRSGNSDSGKSGNSYRGRAHFPPDRGLQGTPKPQRNSQPGEPRRQWHANFPKDTR